MRPAGEQTLLNGHPYGKIYHRCFVSFSHCRLTWSLFTSGKGKRDTSGIYLTATMCRPLWQAVSSSWVPLLITISILWIKRRATREIKWLVESGGECSICPPSLPLFTLSRERTPVGTSRMVLPISSVYCHVLCVPFHAVTHPFGKCLPRRPASNQ